MTSLLFPALDVTDEHPHIGCCEWFRSRVRFACWSQIQKSQNHQKLHKPVKCSYQPDECHLFRGGVGL